MTDIPTSEQPPEDLSWAKKTVHLRGTMEELKAAVPSMGPPPSTGERRRRRLKYLTKKCAWSALAGLAGAALAVAILWLLIRPPRLFEPILLSFFAVPTAVAVFVAAWRHLTRRGQAGNMEIVRRMFSIRAESIGPTSDRTDALPAAGPVHMHLGREELIATYFTSLLSCIVLALLLWVSAKLLPALSVTLLVLLLVLGIAGIGYYTSVGFDAYGRRCLTALLHGTLKIAQGTLGYRISLPVERTDIYGVLSVNFNRMAMLLQTQTEEIQKQAEEIKKQQALSESLLLNVLPAEVAEELKHKGAVTPQYYEDVTILFTDFKGFTASTELLTPRELVELLNGYFTVFDQITVRYGLEKLKTIGDSYMCVAGLPQRSKSHAVDAVLAGFEMISEVIRRQETGGPPWSMRLGVHTGPVVSGVVGIRKFAFDIWGESVNFASRIESSGHPDRINLSESTYVRVKDFFNCEHRGKVMTKERREFDMYFAVGPAATLASSGGVKEMFEKRYNEYFGRELPAFPEILRSLT